MKLIKIDEKGTLGGPTEKKMPDYGNGNPEPRYDHELQL